MTQPGHTLFRRIRCIKSSLDKAEQSFMDNKDIRGELDLMLAEAELKNLRRKKDRPWSWNRQVLACCAALLLVLAGVGGWYGAKDHYRHKARAAAKQAAMQTMVQQPQAKAVKQAAMPAVQADDHLNNTEITKDIPAEEKQTAALNRITISKADMHKLVQSARVELSNSK